MKGVILAGGRGTRLLPITKITNKHLLPVYDRPMIYYPLQILADLGIGEIMIVSGPEYSDDFLDILGSGKEFGVKLAYAIQPESGGIAQALGLAEAFVDNEKVVVILGDNIFEDGALIREAAHEFKKQEKGAKIFLKEVADAQRFGVAEIYGNTIVAIEEKPKLPKTNLAVTGLYMYDNQVFDIIRSLKPSDRGELEITDVNNFYIKQASMTYKVIQGEWTDAGTFDSLLKASNIAAQKLFGK